MIRLQGLPVPQRKLTARERQIAVLVGEGLSTKEIAWSLEIAYKTVETHRYNLMRKMDAHNAAQVILWLAGETLRSAA